MNLIQKLKNKDFRQGVVAGAIGLPVLTLGALTVADELSWRLAPEIEPSAIYQDLEFFESGIYEGVAVFECPRVENEYGMAEPCEISTDTLVAVDFYAEREPLEGIPVLEDMLPAELAMIIAPYETIATFTDRQDLCEDENRCYVMNEDVAKWTTNALQELDQLDSFVYTTVDPEFLSYGQDTGL